MSAKSEYDAAYFTLLRAIEERDDLLRYADWLTVERERLDGFSDVTRDRTDALSRKLKRPIDLTTKPLLEAVGRRRAVVLDEQRKIHDRIAAAEAFVTECELEVDALRG